MPEHEWTPDEQKSATLRAERVAIDEDQADIAAAERALSMNDLPPEVMARVGAVFQFAHNMLEEVHRHPMGVSRAKLMDQIRRWRAKRATIAQNLARRTSTR